MTGRQGFTAATWNVFHGSTPDNLRPTLERLLHMGVSLILWQELVGAANWAMIHAAGMQLAFTPRQYGVSWLPDLWVGVAQEDLRLSPTSYYARGGDGKQYSEAAAAILCDRVGRSLDVVSYHTPSGVQSPHAPAGRTQATRESFRTLEARARAAHTTGQLYGGDDNVDERFGRFRWTLGKPLRQVQAPGATHGRRRRIDDFRVHGIDVGPGLVIPVPAPDDHNVHVRTFYWRS